MDENDEEKTNVQIRRGTNDTTQPKDPVILYRVEKTDGSASMVVSVTANDFIFEIVKKVFRRFNTPDTYFNEYGLFVPENNAALLRDSTSQGADSLYYLDESRTIGSYQLPPTTVLTFSQKPFAKVLHSITNALAAQQNRNSLFTELQLKFSLGKNNTVHPRKEDCIVLRIEVPDSEIRLKLRVPLHATSESIKKRVSKHHKKPQEFLEKSYAVFLPTIDGGTWMRTNTINAYIDDLEPGDLIQLIKQKRLSPPKQKGNEGPKEKKKKKHKGISLQEKN